jgi:mutator protein MutT
MKTYVVVVAVVRNPSGKILLLRKSANDKVYPNKWSFCAGHIKEFEAAEDTVLREIIEETGLHATIDSPVKIEESIDASIGRRWIVACFLCSVKSNAVTLCHENSEYRWVELSEIKDFDMVPGAEKDLKVLGLLH